MRASLPVNAQGISPVRFRRERRRRPGGRKTPPLVPRVWEERPEELWVEPPREEERALESGLVPFASGRTARTALR